MEPGWERDVKLHEGWDLRSSGGGGGIGGIGGNSGTGVCWRTVEDGW